MALVASMTRYVPAPAPTRREATVKNKGPATVIVVDADGAEARIKPGGEWTGLIEIRRGPNS